MISPNMINVKAEPDPETGGTRLTAQITILMTSSLPPGSSNEALMKAREEVGSELYRRIYDGVIVVTPETKAALDFTNSLKLMMASAAKAAIIEAKRPGGPLHG